MLGKKIEIIRNSNSEHILYVASLDCEAYIMCKECNFLGEFIGSINGKNIISDKPYSKKEIYDFFDLESNDIIFLNEYTYDDLVYDIKKSGLDCDSKVMIHSSLKSVGSIVGGAEVLIKAFIDVISNGLVIFPTHTWASIRNDDMVFNSRLEPSCVGALTNVARGYEGFKRSMHPTHSVCAYGVGVDEYLACDLNSKTPADVNGCFGVLKDMDAKILFLGAPLSKNTFIHSVEEQMNVPDRFTDHIYHFISTDGDKKLDYYMPRHFSTKSLHISDHYEKLLPIMLKLNVAKKVYIGNSESYLVDAKMCNELVVGILKKNIHAFDDFEDISYLVDGLCD